MRLMKTTATGDGRNLDWDFPERMKEESWARTWLKTSKPSGDLMQSLMVRAGACSPSNRPSRSALQIESAIEVRVLLHLKEAKALTRAEVRN